MSASPEPPPETFRTYFARLGREVETAYEGLARQSKRDVYLRISAAHVPTSIRLRMPDLEFHVARVWKAKK